jgi:hypothetical protein
VILLDKREIAYTKRNALSMKEVQIKSETILKNLEPYLKGIVGIYMAYGGYHKTFKTSGYHMLCTSM